MSEPPAPSRRLVRFGEFELDPRTGELRRNDVRVTLQEQPLKVLESLLEHPGELVTREELRQRLWQGDTFVDFDHGVNAAVKRLRETLGDSADTPRFIETLPRRGYRFIAPVEQEPIVGGDPETASPDRGDGNKTAQAVVALETHPKRWSGRLVGAAGLGILLAAASGAWLLSRSLQPPAPPMKVVPLTALTGFEIGPTLSPDLTRVAFTWNGEAQDNFDIYVKLAGSAEVTRLTTNPAFEVNPSWSPDGLQIAYVRAEPQGKFLQVWVMSALGDGGHKVSDLPVFMGISWSPDGRFINATQVPPNNGIYRIPVEGGVPSAILRPTAPEMVLDPSFSPDGRFLAYTSCQDPIFHSDCHVQVVAVDAGLAVHGAPRPLTRHRVAQVEGITWSRDGQFLVYAAGQEMSFSLWRVGVDGKRPPERIEVAGLNATAPLITRSGDLAFSRRVVDMDVYRLQPGRAAEPVATSAVVDGNPQLSPDGLRFAFCSMRSDAEEVWTAASDGSDAHQLTHGPGNWQCSPAYSPDGGQIAFNSRTDNGDWNIWTVDAGGGIPRQITKEKGKQYNPTWSRDGAWIYFSWAQGSGREIWRTHLKNGTSQQVTHGGGGLVGRESADGQSVLYQPKPPDGALVSQPLSGGAPRTLLPCVANNDFSVLPQGIYYVQCPDTAHPDPNPRVHVLNPVTGEDRPLGALEKYAWGLAVSPDGQTILYSRLISDKADLMLIQNFR